MQRDADNSRGPSSKRRNKPQDQQAQESRSIDPPDSNRSYQNGDHHPASVLASFRGPLERLANVAKYLESFRPDISTIEAEYGAEIDREKEIQRLYNTVETLTSAKGEELERLKKENETLKSEQEACSQEKEKWQTLQAELRSESDEAVARTKQKCEKELQEEKVKSQKQLDVKKAKLEAEIKEKVRDADNKSKKLEAENNDLKKSLSEVKEELKTEKRRDTLALKALEDEHASLAKELEQVRFEFPVEGKPVDFYMQNFQGICNDIQATSSRYFQKPSEQASTETVYQVLRNRDPIFNSISLLDTDFAGLIRVRMAQHVISSSLCEYIWQPFLTETSDPRRESLNQFLSEVSQCLAASKGHGESAWRALTLRGIDTMASSSSKRQQLDFVLKQVVGVLDPLIPIEESDKFKDDLRNLVEKSISTWEFARKDEHRIDIKRRPDPNDETNWHNLDDIPHKSALPAAATTTNSTLTPLCLFPHVSQRSQEGKEVLIHRGSALFPSSYVWTEALLERKDHEQEMERVLQETRSKFNSRRTSVPASPLGGAGGKSGFMTLDKHEYR